MKIALSTSCCLTIEQAFDIAERADIDWVELFPLKNTTQGEILKIRQSYGNKTAGIQIAGIHLPFWVRAKDFWTVFRGESGIEKLYQLIFRYQIGSMESNPAIELAKLYRPEYVVLHHDIREEAYDQFGFSGLRIAIENERPKPYRAGGKDSFRDVTRNISRSLVVDLGHHNLTVDDIRMIKNNQREPDCTEVPIAAVHIPFAKLEGKTAEVIRAINSISNNCWYVIELSPLPYLFSSAKLVRHCRQITDQLREILG